MATEKDIRELVGLMRGLFPSTSIKDHKISLDIKVEYIAFPKNGKKSLREYLIDMVRNDFDKALKIYAILIDENSTYQKLYDALNAKRFHQRAEGTTGAQILKKVVKEVQSVVAQSAAAPQQQQSAYNPGLFGNNVDAKQATVSADGLPADIPFDAAIASKATVSVSNYFPTEHIEPTEYRRAVYFDIQTDPIGLKKTTPHDIKPIDQRDQKHVAGLSVKDLSIADVVVDEFVPLLTLTPNDSISNLTANCRVEWGYSESAHQYYIKPIEQPPGGVLYVNYDLHKGIKKEIPKESFPDKDSYMQALAACSFEVVDKKLVLKTGDLRMFAALTPVQKLNVLTTYFNSFGDKDLSQNVASGSIDAFNLMLNEKMAACRHRVMLCMAFADVLQILNVNIVASGLHARIEVSVNNDMFTADLGGASVNIKKLQPEGRVETISGAQGLDAAILERIEKDKSNGRVTIYYRTAAMGSPEWQQRINAVERLVQYQKILGEYGLTQHESSDPVDKNFGIRAVEFADVASAARALAAIQVYEQTALPADQREVGQRAFSTLLEMLDPESSRGVSIKSSR